MTLELDITDEESENLENGGFITLLVDGLRIVITAEEPCKKQ